MYLLLDIGGTTTRMAVSEDGKTLTKSNSFPTEKEFEREIDLITETFKDLATEDKIEAAVVGIAGTFDKEKTTLISSPHLPNWVQQPIKQSLEDSFDCPVYLENDAHLGGLGEASFGAGKDYPIVGFITVGTGVGGVRIIDQKIDRNAQGFEVGHQIIAFDGNDCHCGGKGHLESFVAGAYLEKLYGQKAENIKDEKIWDEIGKYLSIGLHNTILHWSPDIIVLGGSVSHKIPLEIVLKELQKSLIVVPCPEIVKSTLGSEVGLYGGLKIIQSINSE